MLRLGENHFWFALASSDALLYATGLAADLVQEMSSSASPMELRSRSKDHASRGVVATLFGDEILSLKYYWFRELELDGIPVIVTRTGWTAEVGYEVYLRRDGGAGEPSSGNGSWRRGTDQHQAHRSGRHPSRRGRHPGGWDAGHQRSPTIRSRSASSGSVRSTATSSSRRARRPCAGSATKASGASWSASRSRATSSR